MEEITQEANVPVENKVQQYMMGAWAKFAREPKNALSELGWPRYDANGTGSHFVVPCSWGIWFETGDLLPSDLHLLIVVC